jgi:SAM-dependent methyltransferase
MTTEQLADKSGSKAVRPLREARHRLGRLKQTLGNHLHAVIPRGALTVGLREYPRFLADRRRYQSLSGARLRWSDHLPQLFDCTSTSPFDAHYTYQDAWAAQRIFAAGSERHVDVGSRISYVAGLTAFVPVTFVDIRPLQISLPGLSTMSGSLLELPFEDQSIPSLSCLHVAEHVGLGRYGDPLDPDGTIKAARELERVLAPGGSLYFSLPVGRPRIVFNAHRIHDPVEILGFFPDLKLEEFAGVNDRGEYLPDIEPAVLRDQVYACGLFRLGRPRD